MGINIIWDCEISKTPEGYYQVQGGIEYAIAKSLAAAPFADLLWMETKTADLVDAKRFAEAIHAEFPDKMLAYNLSPSFNWDTTGMSDERDAAVPRGAGQARLRLQLHHLRRPSDRRPGRRGVRHRAAAGRHAVAGPAAAEVPAGRLTLPDAADAGGRAAGATRRSWPCPGGTAATKAMGKGSTQHQHLVQTEVPTKLLEEWLALWTKHHRLARRAARRAAAAHRRLGAAGADVTGVRSALVLLPRPKASTKRIAHSTRGSKPPDGTPT